MSGPVEGGTPPDVRDPRDASDATAAGPAVTRDPQVVRGPDGRWGTGETGATQLRRDPGGRWRVHPVQDGGVAPTPAVPSDGGVAGAAEHARTPDGPGGPHSPPDAGPAGSPPGGGGDRTVATPETGPVVLRIALAVAGRPDQHVVVTGDSGQPASGLHLELQRLAGSPGRLHLGDRPLPDDGMVADLGLRDGDRLVLEPADPIGPVGPVGPVDPVGPVEAVASAAAGPVPAGTTSLPATGPVLRIVGGPDAGRTIPLPPGTATVGRSARSTIRIDDPSTSRTHVTLQTTPEGVVMRDMGSENGARVEGTPQEHVLLEPGDLLRLGDTLLELGAADDVERVVPEPRPGGVGIHRRFRGGTEEPPSTIRHPRKETPPDPQPLNLLMALLPAAGIGSMALLFGRPEMLVFAAMSPLLAVARTMSSKRTHRERTIAAELDHRAALARFRERLEGLRAQERHHRRAALPDAARAVEAALRPTTELWSRRGTDADALTLRVGAAWAPSAIRVEARAEEDGDRVEPGEQPWLPVGVSLPEFGGLALVGPLERLRPLACSLVLQAVALHAPSELQVMLLAGPDAEASWSWLRWLPHVRRGRLEPSLTMGTEPSSRSARVEELRRVLAERREAAEGRATVFSPRLLVIHDDASARLGEGVAEILREGGPHGIHALCLDALQVPEGCNASVVLGGRVDGARVERRGLPPVTGVITDAVPPSRCEEVAVRLAPLQVIGEDDEEGMPTSCRLLSTIGMEPTVEAVRARWAARSPSARAVIGVGTERPVALDLTRDGPHALVAGTTGAGKSEFIKTLVASLAVENHPDDLSFLFIDFKGGGDYRTLTRLPHAVALTTNLDDPAAFDRTLQLLEAEMGRRVGMLQAVGTNSIEGYAAVRAGGRGAPPPPMPRLVVVVDEFAELKDKAPAQLDRLVSVARTGRSVGVHLVLATQRPSGVVTSQIDANVGLRVCFRVTDEQDSKEIVGSPLAGRIAERHRGRCVVTSAATPLTEVQTARVAGARPGSVSAAPIRAMAMTWDLLGRPLPRDRGAGEVPDAETDLHDIVEAMVQAVAGTGWAGNAIPWPDELPDALALSDLPHDAEVVDPDGLRIPIGLVDVPERQRREVATIDVGAGHVVVAGSARTGRSTALRTFLAGLVQRHGPADVRVIGLDFGGGALLPVAQLPHCAAFAMEDLARTEEIVADLEQELARRREVFAAGGWPDLRAQRRQSDVPMPWLVLVLDGWDNLAEEGVRQGLPGRVAGLLARGTPQGLHAVLAGDRGTTHSQIARHLTHRHALRFNRVVDAELQGILARQIPAHQPPGRAVQVTTGRLLQLAELDDPDGVGQGVAFQRALAAAAADAGGRGAGGRGTGGRGAAVRGAGGRSGGGESPVPMPAGIGRPTVVDLASVLADGPPEDMALPVLLGVHDPDGTPLWLDADEAGGPIFVVGPPGTGRSTALAVAAAAALAAGMDVAVVADAGSPLSTVTHPRVRHVPLDVEPAGVTPPRGGRLLVVVDDLDRLGDGRGPQEVLGGEVEGRAVLVAADIGWMRLRFSGLAAAARRTRRGLLLSPPSTANGVEMLGGSLSPTMVRPPRPGRGVADVGGGTVLTVVPPADVHQVFSAVGEESGGSAR